MPRTKSAKKALKVSVRRHGENLIMKHEIKNQVKGLRLVIASKKSDATTELAQAYSALDKAAKKHFIHKKKASRLKSRLALATQKSGLKTDSKVSEKKAAAPKPATKKTAQKPTKK